MNGLTAADYADTGQWRLIVKIYATGISAYLENTIHTGLLPELLFSSEWERDEEALLSRIENAVYDHPRVLDDFSARIIIYDPRTLFIPTSLIEETEGWEETVYTAVYDVNPAEVMTDTFSDITAAYSPAAGLKGFLNRTFPGARVENHLMTLIRELRQGEGIRLYAEVRKGETDLILFDGNELISAATQPTGATNDIVYHILNLLDIYEISPQDARIVISGEEIPGELTETFGKLGVECEMTETK